MAPLLEYDEQSLVRQLSRLPAPARSAFAAACAERLLPAYEHYCASGPPIDPQAVGKVLAKVWNFANGGKVSELTEDAVFLTDAITSDDDDDGKYADVVADDALAATAYAVRSVDHQDAREAAWAARRAYEAVDRFVAKTQNATSYTPTVESTILSDDLVQSELKRQDRDISLLASADPSELRNVIVQMRDSSRTESALPLV